MCKKKGEVAFKDASFYIRYEFVGVTEKAIDISPDFFVTLSSSRVKGGKYY
jgi:hypothetical protein